MPSGGLPYRLKDADVCGWVVLLARRRRSAAPARAPAVPPPGTSLTRLPCRAGCCGPGVGGVRTTVRVLPYGSARDPAGEDFPVQGPCSASSRFPLLSSDADPAGADGGPQPVE